MTARRVDGTLTKSQGGPTMKVKDVMTRDVVTVNAGATLKHAAKLLVEHRISGLPVVDVDGRVLGVKHVLADPRSLEIEVRDGEVTLGGALDNDADVAVLPKLVARVPGVVGVRSALVSPYGTR